MKESGWLIEIIDGGPKWFSGGPKANWTRDANEAIRFSRKEDADRFAEWSSLEDFVELELQITEHVFGLELRPAGEEVAGLVASATQHADAAADVKLAMNLITGSAAIGARAWIDDAVVELYALGERLEVLSAERDAMEGALKEEEQSFDLRWKDDMRAVKRWREANPGNDLILPDHADLVVWLLDQLAAERSRTGRPLKRDELRDVAMAHGHFIFPIRPGVSFVCTDEETGEILAKGTLKGKNVVPIRAALQHKGETDEQG